MATAGRVKPEGAGGPGFALVEQTLRTIERYEMFAGGTVVVGVSGGPDSVCLLDVLLRLAPALDLTLAVAHVDHRISDRSEEIATAVARDAAEKRLDVHVARAPDLSGPNFHARARDFRYSFFATVAQEVGAERVVTGHTLDDRVETTLARLIHGAATEGLAGLGPVERDRVRPLIAVRRPETRAYCDELSLRYVDDPGNEDPRFECSVVRAHVLRAIEEEWGDGAVRAMAESAERLREDATFLARLADTLYGQMAHHTDEGISFDLDRFTDAPRALRRRLLESAVGRVRDRSGGINAALDALERDRKPNARFAVATGIEIEIDAARVLVRRPLGRPG